MEKHLNLPTFLISAFLIRLLIVGAGIGDSIVMIVLGALYGGHVYLAHIKEPIVNKDVKDKINQMDELLTKVKNKVDSYSLGAALKK